MVSLWEKALEERKPGSGTVGEEDLAWLLLLFGSSVAWPPPRFRCSAHLVESSLFRICDLASSVLGGPTQGS